MKRLFSLPRIARDPGPKPPAPTTASPAPGPSTQAPGLPSKYVVPAVPHPCPHDRLALLVTPEGLLIRPHASHLHPNSHIRIPWGKSVEVLEESGDGQGEEADWTHSVVVYGLVGVLELFSASYLLVISAKSDVGCLLEESHAVYGVKGVTAVPLTYDRAKIILNTLASRNASTARPSLLPANSTDTMDTMDTLREASDSIEEEGETEDLVEPPPTDDVDVPLAPRVQFADQEPIKVDTRIDRELPEQDAAESLLSPSSGVSTPSSDMSSSLSPISQTLAKRLSFWSLLSRRTPQSPEPGDAEAENGFLDGAGDVASPVSDTGQSIDSAIASMNGGTHAKEPSEVLQSIVQAHAPPPPTQAEQRTELETKIVRQVIREYTKGGMYFSYHFDITRSLQNKYQQIAKSRKEGSILASLTSNSDEESTGAEDDGVNVLAEAYPTLPLWRRCERQFWWNEWLSKPFVDAGLHSYVLPIMQGYFQVASFPIPREPEAMEEGDAAVVDYILVSRRSRDRAGLRYQRRGIDEDAHVANFVETETIVRVEREGVPNVFSYIQIRGSIPVFWAQPGMGLHPAPVLSPDRTHQQQVDALKRHFQQIVPRYGPNTIINLAEQRGKEGAVTCAYGDIVEELAWDDVQYNAYDFHAETKGMKYENISKLITRMERTFEQQGYLWVSGSTLMSEQKGVFRVNCIDCLDRTNVVQSAFARYVLNRQMGAVALLNPVGVGRTEEDIVFNNIWANNGDAISRAYAGTSALKGDFTRTGKRDLGGLLNDGINSLARMYTSTFGDWFSQAVLDFMLGHRTLTVFSEFLLKLQSSDPRDLIRVSKIRAEAIATSVARVLPEGERLLHGWTVFGPEAMNTKMADKFEEKVLLLSARALYIISYDYELEKVKIATRVPLEDIISITKGAYIVSPLEEASRDPLQNAGFIVSWMPSNQETRVTSYSVRNSVDLTATGVTSSAPPTPTSSEGGPLPATASAVAQEPPLPASPGPSGIRRFSTGGPLARMLSRAAAPAPAAPFLRPLALPGAASRAAAAIAGKPAAVPALSTAVASAGPEIAFAAFKALPADPARMRQGDGFADAAGDELSGVASAREAVELMVGAVARACEDVGSGKGEFVKEGDVVSLAEAQKVTSVYAKMEYGVKRLLWLGG